MPERPWRPPGVQYPWERNRAPAREREVPRRVAAIGMGDRVIVKRDYSGYKEQYKAFYMQQAVVQHLGWGSEVMLEFDDPGVQQLNRMWSASGEGFFFPLSDVERV